MINFEKATIEPIKIFENVGAFYTGSYRLTLIQISDFKTHIIQFKFRIYKIYDKNDLPRISFQIYPSTFVDKFGIQRYEWDFETRDYIRQEFKKFFDLKMKKVNKWFML